MCEIAALAAEIFKWASRDRNRDPKLETNLAPVVVPIIYPAAVPPIIRPVTAAVIGNRPIIRCAVRVITVWIVTVRSGVSVTTARESEPYAD
jgi:hypothetical protein